MKTILSLLFALTLGTAFGQFIPQQMGYNPDVNGDEFIGVDDVMGTLALYDNAFDNGDSIVVTSWTLPNEEYLAQSEVSATNNWSHIEMQIPEETDVLYIHQTEDRELHLDLPQGPGFKVLHVFIRSDHDHLPIRIYRTTLSNTWVGDGYLGLIQVDEFRQKMFTFVRGHDGLWYD